MPHCILEYAKPLEAQLNPTKLVQAVYEGAYSTGLFEGPDIKTRAIAYQEYLTGADKTAFIHVTVKLLKGRTDEQKQRLSSTVIKRLISLQLSDISITVEIVDMESNSYAKHLT
ncbi:MAG: 5-carboxymethyl-2-hydroxymuconate Delta-isomerase [Amphritea sp.]|nr:5-carboxymethyl-2-hydroxymuconate Delta-isomerase [Amphritea sp.]